MKIIDNFLQENNFLEIKEEIINSKFPLYCYESPTNYNFRHSLYSHDQPQSPAYDYIFQTFFLKVFEESGYSMRSMFEANICCYPNNSELIFYDHKYTVDCKSAILHLNTCNGLTVFEDNIAVESIANRLILFDSKEICEVSTCTDENTRWVINLNYI